MKGMLDPVLRGESYRPCGGTSDSSRHPVSERSPVAMCWTERSREAARFESAAKETRSSKEIWHPSNVSKTMSKKCAAGYECGLVFEGFNDLQEFDQVEAYIMVEVPR